MKRVALSLALFAAVTVAGAQATSSTTGIRARIAYGTGETPGAEFAVALPVGTFLGESLFLEPSYVAAGLLGGGDDPNVYRATLFAHRTFKRGLGVRLGVGYSGSSRKGGSSGTSDVIFDLGVEIPFTLKILGAVQPYADIHNVFSGEDRLTGFFVGVGVKL